jgi:hypothetical protein
MRLDEFSQLVAKWGGTQAQLDRVLLVSRDLYQNLAQILANFMAPLIIDFYA